MSEKIKPSKNLYTYKYVQFTATSNEKKQIKHFANKENFKTTSEFVRKRVSSSNTLSKDDFVKLLLIIHDSLHDMCDKGDQHTITLLQDWTMEINGSNPEIPL